MNSPSPKDIRNAREAANLTIEAAASVVHASKQAWYQWESGRRDMHPAFWELFLLKTSKPPGALQ